MNNEQAHERLDELAVEIEERIEETDELLAGLPEFEPRSRRSRKLQAQARGEEW